MAGRCSWLQGGQHLARRRIRDASPDELGVWTRRILRAGTVDDVFG
jgi:hypothetical protein